MATSHMADDTARVVEKNEVRKAYKFGGDTITFTPEEMIQIRQCFGEPVIRIIGFKSLSLLPLWANINKATFVYPSEADFVGSTRTFSALQQKLLKDKKMGVAWFIARRNAAPVITAIVPGQEKFDENGDQTMPPGLWLVPLPFADDIRQLPEQLNHLRTTDELTDSMRKVVEQLQLPKGEYDPSKYPNPDLQWFYRILQAMALEEEVPEKPDDKTIPKYRQINKRVAGYIEEFGEQFEVEYSRQVKTKKIAGKRPLSGGEETLPKRPKVEKVKKEPASQDAITTEEMAALNKRGKVSSLTMPMLKEYLKGIGEGTSGKKPELVDRVLQHLESKGF
jgi:ATP-dependent DNA helicase 2 subunit 1